MALLQKETCNWGHPIKLHHPVVYMIQEHTVNTCVDFNTELKKSWARLSRQSYRTRKSPCPTRIVLQCTAVCCSVLQCVAMRCNALQCVELCWIVLQCVARCVATCCNVMQSPHPSRQKHQTRNVCIHTYLSVRTYSHVWFDCIQMSCVVLSRQKHQTRKSCSVLQCFTVCCNVLQCDAVTAR